MRADTLRRTAGVQLGEATRRSTSSATERHTGLFEITGRSGVFKIGEGNMICVRGENGERAAPPPRDRRDERPSPPPPPVAAPERVRTASPEIDENGVVALTDANYEETLKTGVWVVDVWADWCGPCMAMKPVFGAIARNHTDLLPPGSAVSINFAQLDRSETSKVKNPKMGRDNRFWTSNSLPRFVIFQDGKVIGSIVGYNTEPKFRNLLRGKLKGIAAPALQDGRVGQEFYPLPDN